MATKPILFLLFLMFISKNAQSQEGMFFETGLDPKMLALGPYEDSESGALDYILKVGYKTHNYELGVFAERFQATKFYTSGVFVAIPFIIWPPNKSSKTRLGAALGMDAGIIDRSALDSKTFTYALNAELRLILNKNMTVKYTANFRERSDLVRLYNEKNSFRFAGYVSFAYSLPF